MKLLVVALLVACSKPGADCEALKTKYLAVAQHNVDEAVSTMEAGSSRDEIAAQGKKEMAMANERFVGACKAIGKLDETCFDYSGDEATRSERKKRCKDQRRELDHRLYAP